MTHTLRISHAGSHNSSATPDSGGNYPVRMIRKQLSDAEVTPLNVRYNTTTLHFQVTFDGGSTWVDQPTGDPRTSPAFRHPARTGSDPQCNAAGVMTDTLNTWISGVLGAGTQGAAATGLGVLMTLIFDATFIGLVISLIFYVVDALFAIGVSTISSALTGTVYNELANILYCNIGSDGQVSETQFATIQSQVTSIIGGTAAAALNLVLSLFGPVGLSNIGAVGTTTRDCSGMVCAWCHEFTGADLAATFTGGSPGVSEFLHNSMPAGTNITHIEFDWICTNGGGSSAVAIWKDAISVPNRLILVTPLGSSGTTSVDLNNGLTSVVLGGNTDGSGVFTVTRVLLRGGGVPPPYATNC